MRQLPLRSHPRRDYRRKRNPCQISLTNPRHGRLESIYHFRSRRLQKSAKAIIYGVLRRFAAHSLGETLMQTCQTSKQMRKTRKKRWLTFLGSERMPIAAARRNSVTSICRVFLVVFSFSNILDSKLAYWDRA